MQVLIDIANEDYSDIVNGEVKASALNYRVFHAIRNGTPLPKGHGDLRDTDSLKDSLDYYIKEAGWSDEINKALTWVKDEFIDAEEPVIEKDKEGGEK